MAPDVSERIRRFGEHCSRKLSGAGEEPEACICVAQELLPEILKEVAVFAALLKDLINGGAYPDVRQSTMFDNELLLFSDPARRFTLRCFFWGPREYTPVHDHSAWGVIGALSGELEVINFDQLSAAADGQKAVLSQKERFRLHPGDTTFTLSLQNGIHKIGNPADNHTILSLSLYGKPLSRGYINEFDLETGEVRKIISPALKKRLSALRALLLLDESFSRELRETLASHPLEIFRQAARHLDSHENITEAT